jgi:hypothetical protein
MRLAIVLISIFAVLHAGAFPADIYVPDQYPAIQDAINASVYGDTVIVRPGTYKENINFVGKMITVKSEQGAAVTTIDGNQSGSVVTFHRGEKPDSVLDGFSITNGFDPNGGGGISCYNFAHPTIINNIITGNRAQYGGGISCYWNCRTVIRNNTITNNVGAWSGGIFCCYSGLTITNNNISGNMAVAENKGAGGIGLYSGCCTITGNVITGNVGCQGGGIRCGEASRSQIDGNYISKNSAVAGGGLYLNDSSPTVFNNTLSHNSAKYGGGWYSAGSTGPFFNNNIINNAASRFGGGFVCYNGNLSMDNTILWGNSSPLGPESWIGPVFPSTVSFYYSDVKGGPSSCHVEPGCGFIWGQGNIDADPVFVDPAEGDFHLTWNSPCRDAGKNSFFLVGDSDFEGDPRKSQGTVDIGADEVYHHLYHFGSVVPGGVIGMKVVGPPGSDASIAIGWKAKNTPYPTPHGYLWLTLPIRKTWSLGVIPRSGVLSWDGTVPSAWLPGEQYPFQALVGPWGGASTQLTNLMFLDVE